MAIANPPYQRALDFAVALPLAALLVVPIAILLVAIRIETRGNPLFLQNRVGMGQRRFAIWKLRTMHVGTRQAASHEVGRATLTPLGARLRRLKLDELPQVFNVLAGHMSFIGPRPCLPVQEELIAERERRGLYALRPGVTGPAQLERLDMSQPVLLAAREAAYFGGERSFFDWRLLLATLLGQGRGDAVLDGAETET